MVPNPGFDLTIQDSYFTIDSYFHWKHIFHESYIVKKTVNKMVFKPANKYQIIQQCHSFQKNFLDDCRKQQLFEYL